MNKEYDDIIKKIEIFKDKSETYLKHIFPARIEFLKKEAESLEKKMVGTRDRIINDVKYSDPIYVFGAKHKADGYLLGFQEMVNYTKDLIVTIVPNIWGELIKYDGDSHANKQKIRNLYEGISKEDGQ